MNIDTRNKVLSIVLGIVILALSWLLYDSIVTPYQEVLERQAMTERVRYHMSTIKDVLIQYDVRYGKYPPAEGGLDSVVQFVESDSAMISLSDSLLSYQGEPFPAGQLIYSPRDQQRFIYSVNDTIRPPLYLLQDPSEDYNDEIGSLSRTTMRNAPSWN
ncbi:MAG TPA: hypothetical protein DF712_10975 [Balneola sp.]|jgi:hypothetical protein|nr:hypothetical protein [Bacteroidota bacterium]MAC06283.1 hypothetical protein [Balneola sp.]MAO78466.1 hypothetical protein [Balneola sp.]MBF63053.1 hypothetical protein [Balneola sp.]HAW78483.1 hypothetical protein [Balneola sp.]|tara:strand:- start:17879 stop:18355 length:477 start_codon:yes stop_codon:yes gene_type:complete